ncbi:NAD(P)/FAD-dependent oxidoreductase [Pseudonocardia sp. H11422]|uniref:NAD(P)/FAD-dependent oxidoreductase n=1 Tax=Pseudonocardia sp. H11422 TaxID=2835866 RepID=UPI0027E3841D|nr:NAD(P)/FAD-dependent oxidoreductase [Pseudonocardia sp. H11422]
MAAGGVSVETAGRRPRIVVVGTGFAGYYCLRTLESRLPPDAAELVAVNPADHMLYVPLLPEVAAAILEPRHVAVPLRTRLPRTRVVLGNAAAVDLQARTYTVLDIEERPRTLPWDRLVFACGAVTRLLSVPGVADHAKGFKSIAEAVYLRDHVLRQLELAEQADDPAERAARTTFVVVGAGYTGTEVVGQGVLLTREGLRHFPRLRPDEVRWMLLDLAPRVLPGLNPALSGPALRVLRRRGVEVRLQTTVTEVTPTCARLSDGTEIPTRTVVWCVGVRPDPLVEAVGLPTREGRVAVDEHLAVPGHAGVYAAGDVAAVPDPGRPGEITTMTAQHAQRQGRLAGNNIAASLGHGQSRPYQYEDRGFVVDLGGFQAVADPFHVPVTGVVAKAITRGYHLVALPAGRSRVAMDWLVDVWAERPLVQFGLVSETAVRLGDADRIA